jgi:hypothetical protein
MSKKTAVIVVIVLVCVAVVLFAYMRLTQAPSSNTLPPDPSGKLNVISKEQEVVPVNDVFGGAASPNGTKTNGTSPAGTDNGNVGQQRPLQIIKDPVTQTTSALVASTGQYDIVAFSGADGRSFLIYITVEDVKDARQVAEQDLVDRLGIPKEKMCGLPIRVTVAPPFDENFSREDLGLSFCPGSEQF